MLTSQTAIITGAGRGIGRATARRLAASGAGVVLAARTAAEIEQARGEIERAGGRARAVTCDVTRPDDVDRLVAAARSWTDRIDVLVNAAGVAPRATIDQMDPAVFDRIIATNIRSIYLCSRAVWPVMSAAQGGMIVNISSVAADDPFPGFAAYGASKAFVNAFTRALAAEGAPRGIRVYGIAPGAVETRMLREAFPDYPREKTLDPDDVAAVVALLLSPACRYSSGETIRVKKE